MPSSVLAFLLGVACGLRSMTPPAAVSCAASLGWLHLENTPLAFMGARITAYILTALAIGELISDKLPKTPSRKALVPFAGRILTAALSGAALAGITGLVAGVFGAIAGTLGGYEFRRRLVQAIGGKDLPIALLEDVIAVGAAYLIVTR